MISKHATGKRTAGADLSDALTVLREAGLVPWEWIVDETRTLYTFRTAATVADYVAETVPRALIDRWDGEPAPQILCESKSLAGVLYDIAATYACPIAATSGQVRGFLITEIAPTLQPGQRILYLGDWDWGGHQIEAATRRTLDEHGRVRVRAWERIALTEEQVREHDLPVISKADRRYRPTRYFDAVETEALGQAEIVAAVRARLDELMPEPIGDVRVREQRQRAEVAEQLRGGID